MTVRGLRRGRTARALAGVLAGAAGGLVLSVTVPVAFGWRPLTVMSGSMSPAIHTGDVVVTRPVPAASVDAGDVVTFRDPERTKRLITHRVRRVDVDRDRVAVVTQGDANNTSERWTVPSGGTVGRVVYRLPKIGYVLHTVSTPWGQVGFVGVPLFLWGLLTVRAIWRDDPAQRGPAGLVPVARPARTDEPKRRVPRPEPVRATVGGVFVVPPVPRPLPSRPVLAPAPVRPALAAAPVRAAPAAAPARAGLSAVPVRWSLVAWPVRHVPASASAAATPLPRPAVEPAFLVWHEEVAGVVAAT